MPYLASLTFPDGWNVRLRCLLCAPTYPEDVRSAEVPRSHLVLRRFTDLAEQLFPATPVHAVVPPEATTLSSRDGSPIGKTFPTPSQLPPVCCIGDLEADAGTRDVVLPTSRLVIIWFQGVPPPVPIEPQVVDVLSRFDWSAHATNCLY
ncbi:MAG: hypothetical protein ACTHMS_24305 [Jatrophihabitans sp.]|uniref:hypothetical protein n=1 Tax=Jatrophihabitans sp. TaxID=1932789 RepID=UPI003F7D763C